MQTVLTIYVVGAILGSAVFLLAGFQGYRRPSRELWPPGPDSVQRRMSEPFDASHPADVGAAASVALNRVLPHLRDRGTGLDIAVRPGLLVRASGHQLADILEQMLMAISGGMYRRVLLSAATHGSQVAISVTNDAPRTDLQTLQAAVRDLSSQMALRGASLDARVVPDQGASVVLRVAAASPRDDAPALGSGDSGTLVQAAEWSEDSPARGEPARNVVPAQLR